MVIAIIGMVTAGTIGMVVHAMSEVGVREGAGLLAGMIGRAGSLARDSGRPTGLRFEPDPANNAFCRRVVLLETLPDYDEGLVTPTDPATLPDGFEVPRGRLMLEQSDPALPTYWAYNVRAGDQIRVGQPGRWMTVVGPSALEGGDWVAYYQPLDRGDGRGPIDYLWLADGLDNDGDGWVDSGCDGLDNDGDHSIDEADEWESESWGSFVPAARSAYAIRRRPLPARGEAIGMPPGAMIGPNPTPELIFEPSGATHPGGRYVVPSRLGLDSRRYTFDVSDPAGRGETVTVSVDARTGRASAD